MIGLSGGLTGLCLGEYAGSQLLLVAVASLVSAKGKDWQDSSQSQQSHTSITLASLSIHTRTTLPYLLCYYR